MKRALPWAIGILALLLILGVVVGSADNQPVAFQSSTSPTPTLTTTAVPSLTPSPATTTVTPTAVPTPTVTVTATSAPETVLRVQEVSPRSCLAAIQSAERRAKGDARVNRVVTRYRALVRDAVRAGAAGNPRRVRNIQARLESINTRLDAINAANRRLADRFNETKQDCRAKAR